MVRERVEMLPIILKLRLTTMAMAGFMAAGPVPASAPIATITAGHVDSPIAVSFYDENEHQHGVFAISRDGTVSAADKPAIERLFRDRRTYDQKMIAQRTLAMFADIQEHYPDKTIYIVSGYRDAHGESRTSPHRAGRAIDFHIPGASLIAIRDYLWTTYTQVGVGYYPSEQFVHLDSRTQDTSWTFLHGANHYNPFWARLDRDPDVIAARHRHAMRLAGS